MDLDYEQGPILKNMKTPLLESLSLANNFIDGKQYAEWITSLQHLQSLDLNKNFLTDESVCKLAQLRPPKLSNLKIAQNRKLNARYLQCLSQFNTSELTHLDLSYNLATEQYLKVFFLNKSFQNLKEFKFKEVPNAQNLFQYLNWQSMKNLKVMDLSETDISKSFHLIVANSIKFPALKVLKYGGDWMSTFEMDVILRNLTSFGPIIQLFKATVGHRSMGNEYINISDLNFGTIPRGAYISTQKMTVFKPWSGTKFQVIQVNARPFQEAQKFSTMGFLERMFNYRFFGNKFMSEDSYSQQALIDDDFLLDKALKYLRQIAGFMNIEVVNIIHPNDFYVFEKLWHEKNEGQGIVDSLQYQTDVFAFTVMDHDFKQNLQLPYLRILTYQPSFIFSDNSQFLYLYNQIKSPLIDPVVIILEGINNYQYLSKFVNLFLRRNPNINTLLLISDDLVCKNLEQIFQNVHLPFLLELSIDRNTIQSQCLRNILSQHMSIKKLDLGLNSNLTTVVSDILLQNDFILQRLSLSNNQIEDTEFSKIYDLNTQFLTQLQADQTSITQNAIIWLIANRTETVFPKMRKLSLSGNYFSQEGLTSLFSHPMYFLEELYFYYLADPKMLTKIVLYPTKMDFFTLSYGDIKSLNPQIDKRAFRHATTFYINSKDFGLKDFQIISEMEISRLKKVNLQVNNINDCEFLRYMLLIIKDVEFFEISIKNTKFKGKILNDNCLDIHSPSQGVYFQHLYHQKLDFPNEKSYLPRFYSYIYSNYLLIKDQIDFSDHYFTDDALMELLIHPIDEDVQHLNFKNNFLTDTFVEGILKRPLNHLKKMNFQKNNIKLLEVDSLKAKTFPLLQYLNLAMNDITDQSIDVLVQGDYPELYQLSLQSCDVSLKGFIKLLQINAPKLKVLKLENTLITEWDLVYIAEFVDLSSLPSSLKIMTNLQILYSNSQRIQRMMMEKYGVLAVEIKYESHHLKQKNKALIDLD